MLQQTFNDNCRGPKRDISALRMKLKNIKAQNKKSVSVCGEVIEFEEVPADETCFDQSPVVTKINVATKRKRGKMFTQEEQDLLQTLVTKYSECLDTSQTREAISSRKSSWETIQKEFNAAKLNIARDLSELKIKYKNMKSNGTNFNVSSSEQEEKSSFRDSNCSFRFEIVEAQTVDPIAQKVVTRQKPPVVVVETKEIEPPSKVQKLYKARNSYTYDDSEEESETDDDVDDLEFVPELKRKKIISLATPTNSKKLSTLDDEEEIKLRKENLLLKNSCLKKKERLLELQISIAERQFRREQLKH